MTEAPPDLIVVYNADGNMLSALVDAVRKVVAPASYECPLCQMTHGALTMRGRWRSFVNELPNAVRTYHRDEFLEAFPDAQMALPALLTQRAGGRPEVLVGAEELRGMKGVEDLIAATGGRLAALNPQ